MKPAPKRNNRGIALLITLAVTTVLVTTVLEMNRKARSGLGTAAVMRDRASLVLMAEAGVQVAMAVLIKDKLTSRTDTIQEDWANPAFLQQAMEALPFENGKVEVVIEDEMGKIQVNALVDTDGGHQFNNAQQLLWERFLAISDPFRYMRSMTKTKAMAVIVITWTIGSFLGLVPLMGWNPGQKGFTVCSFPAVISMDYVVYLIFFVVAWP